MKSYAQPIKRLIAELAKLPGIGEKTAARLANYILRATTDDVEKLAESLVEVKRKIRLCRVCLNPSEEEVCHICANPARDRHVICVVEEPDALAAIEESGVFAGTYHVLHGALEPLDGIGPREIHLDRLISRATDGVVEEVILATNFTPEGEATAHVISEGLKGRGLQITRLARGVPVGSELEYVDLGTIAHALVDRR